MERARHDDRGWTDGHARLRRLHQRQGQVGVRGGRHFSEPNPGGRTEPLRPGRGAFRECVGRIRGRERGERVVHTRRPSSQPASRAAAALRPFASARRPGVACPSGAALSAPCSSPSAKPAAADSVAAAAAPTFASSPGYSCAPKPFPAPIPSASTPLPAAASALSAFPANPARSAADPATSASAAHHQGDAHVRWRGRRCRGAWRTECSCCRNFHVGLYRRSAARGAALLPAGHAYHVVLRALLLKHGLEQHMGPADGRRHAFPLELDQPACGRVDLRIPGVLRGPSWLGRARHEQQPAVLQPLRRAEAPCTVRGGVGFSQGSGGGHQFVARARVPGGVDCVRARRERLRGRRRVS
mmetsp:Transcript_10300/g.19500  ORF Transcript_10300/g.19500 Transcript_10300/m.19500 type:complete len:357 (+) Transcript_10300:25-1095(+)